MLKKLNKVDIVTIAKGAKEASYALGLVDTDLKDAALRGMAKDLLRHSGSIEKENKKDIKAAKKKNYPSALIDRLILNDKRIKGMADSLDTISNLKDPVGNIIEVIKRPNGLVIGKMRVPIGVIAIIYESRPNVTSDCVGLCLKSGNSVILRGGSEAINSNIAIFEVLNKSVEKFGLPKNCISIIRDTAHNLIRQLLQQDKFIDLVMPRGGEALIKEVAAHSKIPVIKHYKGVCHVYVDGNADLNMAHSIALNAKVQRPGVCNAMETLLVHRDVAARFLPVLMKDYRAYGVEIRGCEMTKRIIKDAKPAKEEDWYAEYLDLILSVKVVNDLDEAIAHIRKYGSQHSDSIVTDNKNNALKFLREVDSAAVYVNASTRFTDGGEFGMGAEIGISTDKIHARGPMALKELTTYKYVIFGNGQIRK
ncbi:MAG: glutamate-5-semialdehyde dehydrogenase [Candidatus Omnitrophica bacterium CG07_land_8_20_14_0_80_42_15]|uniref:Gamma-glutamyl phosphate reductase n=1 Tax=Candidatus Aquitaenariimonas noxiae TaxID=1974741 RepID=A0A2J0KW37_9BACT|nr:MAG: glutamate-5-semialdehyde dehydrogenase [Candidatus Omnitrophica bacterium CG07_land_8_20_14_0_80_42_15]